MNENVLERIGLEKGEAKIYLALLSLGSASATTLSRETKIERTLVYRVLDRLVEKGLVNYIVENKVKKFSAAKPETLLVQLKEKEQEFETILPQLKKLQTLEVKKEPKIEIYRGLSGVKSMIREILILKQDYYVFHSESYLPGLSIFLEQLMKTIEKEGINERILVKKGFKINIKSKNTRIRYLPDKHAFLTTTGFCGNKVGIIIATDPFLAVGIESKKLADTYKSYFELLWKIAKEG